MSSLDPTSRPSVWGIVAFVWILSASPVSCANKTLLMAQVVYRHGDRAPEHPYPTYAHTSEWTEGLGQLTQLGMQEEYTMGRLLKSRYINETQLLDQSYIHEQVECRSTSVDRALMSAQTQLNGLYPPKGRQIWRQGLDWQPIPIQTLPSSEDRLLRPLANTCLRYRKLNTASEKLPPYQKVVNDSQAFIKWLTPHVGKEYDTGSLYQVNDCMVSDQAHNFSLPSWANDSVRQQLADIADFTFNWNFKGPEKRKLTGGTLVGDIVNHLKSYKADPSKVKKMYLYSGHDTTLIALQSALYVYDDIPPTYSTTYMIELHGSAGGSDLSVKMFYRFGQNDTIRNIKLPNCSLDCPLDKFISQTASVIPEDIEAECLIPTTPGITTTVRPRTPTPEPGKGGGFKIGFIVVLVLLILVIIAAIVFFCWQRRRPQYSEVTKTAEPV